MSMHPLRRITITDETGTNYTDLFADLPLDEFELLGDNGIRAVDTKIPHLTDSPRSTPDAPLGAVIVRWIQARIEHPADRFGWQYLDAFDLHTIAFTDDDELHIINIFGDTEDGRRIYRLRKIAHALDLLVEFELRKDNPS